MLKELAILYSLITASRPTTELQVVIGDRFAWHLLNQQACGYLTTLHRWLSHVVHNHNEQAAGSKSGPVYVWSPRWLQSREEEEKSKKQAHIVLAYLFHETTQDQFTTDLELGASSVVMELQLSRFDISSFWALLRLHVLNVSWACFIKLSRVNGQVLFLKGYSTLVLHFNGIGITTGGRF